MKYWIMTWVFTLLLGILIGIGIGVNKIPNLAKAGKVLEAYEALNKLEQTVNYYAEQGYKNN